MEKKTFSGESQAKDLTEPPLKAKVGVPSIILSMKMI